MTARPRLPSSTDKPPSGLNGSATVATTVLSRDSCGPSTQVNSPSRNIGSLVYCSNPSPQIVLTSL